METNQLLLNPKALAKRERKLEREYRYHAKRGVIYSITAFLLSFMDISFFHEGMSWEALFDWLILLSMAVLICRAFVHLCKAVYIDGRIKEVKNWLATAEEMSKANK